MRKNIFIINITVLILCLFHFLIGCDNKNEPTKKVVAVSKKIVTKNISSTPSSVKVPAVKEKTVGAGSSKINKPDKKTELSKQKTIDASAKQESSDENKIKDETSPVIVLPDEIAKMQPKGITTYNPEGKIDPFVPLFKQGASIEKDRNRRAIRTPLEMVDLSQLKLVAILRAKSGNKALVEESSGKGYVVTKGTYIGNNFGRIIKILNDRIIVEEEIENIIGEKKIQERELKLQKPLGEE